jgi:hypothetical protein
MIGVRNSLIGNEEPMSLLRLLIITKDLKKGKLFILYLLSK